MAEFVFLKALVIIFGVSAVVVFLLGKLKVPSVVGFLLAGVILGPSVLDLVDDPQAIQLLAEIGVVLLLFTIGLEFSLKNLLNLRAIVFGGGLLQVFMTIAAVALVSHLFYRHGTGTAVFNGFLVSLSSTAIVMKILFDRGEVHTSHGRASMGILIFQDLCVVPMMLLMPALAGRGGEAGDIAVTLLKATLMVVAILLAAQWVIPRILHQVVSLRIRELFVITLILLSLGTALITAHFGLSLALGAFLAGVIISESEYSSQAMADILPFKESLTGLFFVSIGMLMNLGMFRANMARVVMVVGAILVVKAAVTFLATLAVRLPLREAMKAAFSLAQIGEFSFVLAVAGKGFGLVSERDYQIFLSVSILTMVLTPLLIKLSAPASALLFSVPFFRYLGRDFASAENARYPGKMNDHVIIIGYGVNGRNVSRVLKESGIPYAVLDFNSDTVRKAKRQKEPIYYGDGTRVEILQKLRIQQAQVLVIAISDPAATRRITQIARKENPHLHIIVRTRYLSEVEDLNKLGANEVIPEEFETSVEIFSRVLHHFHVPINVISDHVENVRSDSYSMLRRLQLPRKPLAERHALLSDIETEVYLLKPGSKADGYTLKGLDLRANTGATIIAVQRKGRMYENPPPDFVLRKGDALLLIGKKNEVRQAVACLETGSFCLIDSTALGKEEKPT